MSFAGTGDAVLDQLVVLDPLVSVLDATDFVVDPADVFEELFDEEDVMRTLVLHRVAFVDEHDQTTLGPELKEPEPVVLANFHSASLPEFRETERQDDNKPVR